MEIKDVFSAQPKSVWEYLCENGQGLYIPAYQRQYSWDKAKISRLLEDACHGFTMLVEHNDAITFIGTIIAIHDTELATVAPLVKGDVPAKVMTIIDGQQRLTTLLLLNTVLHETIKLRSEKLDKDKDEEMWLFEECMKVISRLGKTYEEDKDYGDPLFQYYPRMIRSYDDSWSRKKDKASYRSPIGHYLHQYGCSVRENKGKEFQYSPPELSENSSQDTKYDFLKTGRSTIQKLIKSIAESKDDQGLEFPNFNDITSSISFQNILLKADFPEIVSTSLLSPEKKKYKELMRIVLLANFILDRIAITIVTAKNEDYAFDMFESLNTTGEPLTAFETFKPRVIYAEELESYRESESFQYMNTVEDYLESFSKPIDKQDATSRLIIYFKLAEIGKPLSSRLSDQRRFLRDTYEQLENPSEKRDFVRHLSHVASFMRDIWKKKKTEISVIDFSNDEELLLCIDVLRQFNHTITIGLMVRFYSQVRSLKGEERKNAIDDFVNAVKAITAFSILWRSSQKGTGGIDAIYRDLIFSGCSEVNLPAIARSQTNNHQLDVNLLKKAFWFKLEEKRKITDKDTWVKLASKLAAYDSQKVVARFVLLVATHDSVIDKDGLIIKGKKGILSLMNLTSWRSDNQQTVEHIAPQTVSPGWDKGIYEDADTINRLGNLTLLPQSENSSISNASWEKKKLFYKILSAETHNELDPLLKEAEQRNIKISLSTEELLKNSNYIPMVKAIAKIDDAWTTELIDNRSTRIAELAWDELYKWLE